MQVAGISVDPPDRNSDMVGKLALPFPLLSDARGELAKLFDLWNETEGVAVPATIVVDRTGDIRYLYAGEDFADRPADEEIFAELGGLNRGSGYVAGEPVVRLSAAKARDSVRPDRAEMSLEELIPYYRGAFSTTVSLKRRFEKWGKSGKDASREVNGYQHMVRRYSDAIRQTVKMTGAE